MGDLKKFELASMRSDTTICILGKRAAGKTFLIRDLLHTFRDIPKGIVASIKEEDYNDIVDDVFIYNTFDEKLITWLIKIVFIFTLKSCIVIDHTKDDVFWYKAEPRSNFHIGPKKINDVS